MVSSLIPFGFLPVIAYLITDAFAGHRKALWAALAVGAADYGFSLAAATSQASFDWLGLVGFALLAVLTMASLRSGDAFYFRIHGAVLSILSATVLIVAWHGFGKALLLDMTAKQIGLERLAALDPRLTKDTVAEMLRLLSFQLPWWLLLHALFTIFAAINWSKWTWALVRVPGFLFTILLASAFTQGAVMEDLAAPPKAPAADSTKAPIDSGK